MINVVTDCGATGRAWEYGDDRDTNAIKIALAKVITEGEPSRTNTIYFPKGQYLLTEPLEIPIGTTILGEGITPRWPPTGKTGGTWLIGKHDGNCILKVRSENVRISNINLHGHNNPGKTPETGLLLHRKIDRTIVEGETKETAISMDFVRIERVDVSGWFQKVGICSIGAEQIVFDQVFCRPSGGLAKFGFFTGDKNTLGVSNVDLGSSGSVSNGFGRIINCGFAISDNSWKDNEGSSACLKMTSAPVWSVRDCHFTGAASHSIQLIPSNDTSASVEFTNVFGESGIVTKDYVRHSHIYIDTANSVPITIRGLTISGAGFAHPYRLIHSKNVVLDGAHIHGLLSDNSPTFNNPAFYSPFYYGDFEGQPFKAGLKNSFVMAPDASKVNVTGGFPSPNVTIMEKIQGQTLKTEYVILVNRCRDKPRKKTLLLSIDCLEN